MSKSLKIFLCAAMAAALVLIVCCTLNYRNLGRQLSDMQASLDESTANWKNIDTEKQVLQGDLEMKSAELREAELSLNEQTKKAEDLKKDIAELRQEIEALKGSGD